MKILFRIFLLVIVLFTPSAAFSQSSPNPVIDGYRGIWFELNQKYPYGDKYSGGLGTYTADHIPMAIYVEEVNKTFFVYGGTTSETERHLLCMIGCYDHTRNRLQKPVVVCDKQGVNDPHDDPSLQIDDQGYLWVFVSGRAKARPGFKYRSVKPYDIGCFEKITTEEMTYPQPWYFKGKGFLHLFTKYTGVRELYFETSPDGINWSDDQKLAGIREGDDKLGGHYQVSQQWGDKVGTFFNRHPNGDVDRRTDLYYLETKDMGKTWTTASGEAVSLPLTVTSPLTGSSTAVRVIDYSGQKLNVYLCDVNFDASGNPVCLYITSRGHKPGPDSAPYLWHITRWTGTGWESAVVCNSDHNYDMGSLFIYPDKWLVVAPVVSGPQLWGAGGEVAMYQSFDSGKTWTMAQQVTFNSQRNNSYVRRPQHARDPFLYYWADGNPHQFSISKLFFGDSQGNVYEMPYQFSGKWVKPVKVSR
ncbi:MAG TPA: BNR-4 repeat-containing protein [Prolixibacteraceae bacterium]|nr:BNR-4 repeat-containing protein [Prolixibacteraceae bacterium]HPT30349.1 BNR-4 repeat-containing protein [Prolixibacteraceae bacterium]